MTNKLKYNVPQDTKLATKKLEAGWFGKIFGIGQNALNSGIILIALILLVAIIFLAVYKQDTTLSIIVSIFTLVIGYFLGNNKK